MKRVTRILLSVLLMGSICVFAGKSDYDDLSRSVDSIDLGSSCEFPERENLNLPQRFEFAEEGEILAEIMEGTGSSISSMEDVKAFLEEKARVFLESNVGRIMIDIQEQEEYELYGPLAPSCHYSDGPSTFHFWAIRSDISFRLYKEKHGTNYISYRNERGRTILHYFIESMEDIFLADRNSLGFSGSLLFFLKEGADLLVQDHEGVTPYDLAVKHGIEPILPFLVREACRLRD